MSESTLSDYALCTLDEVKEYYDFQGANAASDSFLEKVIDEFTQVFESYCDRKFVSRGIQTEYHDGNGTRFLWTKQYPITSVSGIYSSSTWAWNSTTLIDSDTYAIRDDTKIVLRSAVFLKWDNGNIRIDYTYGYTSTATVPADLKLACIEEVIRTNKNRKSVDVLSKTMTDGSIARYTKDLMPTTIRILNKHRKMRVR